METPDTNRRRAAFVLGRIDEILAWDRAKEQEKDTRFVELGEYLCEVRAKQYWRLEKLSSFEEFLQKWFADSRRKAYYLMAIHEKLNLIPKHDLQQVGWSKAAELVKIARKERDNFDCATWLHRAKEMPKEGFRCAVERHLTGKETEPWEIEVAGRMLGTDKSRGYPSSKLFAETSAPANKSAQIISRQYHPWAGTGFGTLVVVYPHYASFYDGRVVDHAHNDYLEMLADAGVAGGLFGLCLIGLLYWRGLANLRAAQRAITRATIAGALAACTGLLLHSFVDFNLHIPSNAMIFLQLACLATAEMILPSGRRIHRSSLPC